MPLSRRVEALAKQLGVPTPDEFASDYRNAGEDAAKVVEKVLQDILDEIRRDSLTNVLSSYKVKRESMGKGSIVYFPKSRIAIVGAFSWMIYVEKGAGSDKYNIFDILDEGRDALPYRTKPYPLWGAALRTKTGRTITSNARLPDSGDTFGGINPYTSRSAAFGGSGRPRQGSGVPMVFSRGPLMAIPEKKLYERSMERAKRALKNAGLDDWTITLVQRG